MKSRPILDFIYIGTCLRFLQDASPNNTIHGDGYILNNIESFLQNLNEIGLNVTLRASDELEELKEKLRVKAKDARLASDEAAELRRIATEIRKTFEAETKGFFVYVVTDKRIDVNKLLKNIGQLFKPAAFDSLPEFARYDFKEAGLCIAYERPTAAAFHILRATEDVLRIYYKRFIRPVKLGLTWGQIIHELKNKKSGKKPDAVLINNLENICNSFRNPTQHPDKIYDIQEAQDLFLLCIDVINRMSDFIVRNKKGIDILSA